MYQMSAASVPRALTDEQTAIVGAVAALRAGQRLVVEARAGTGKTTTIGACVDREYERRVAQAAEGEGGSGAAAVDKPMLYTCFNRHTRDEADRKLPHAECATIVQCHTYHALATRFVRDQFADTPVRIAGDPGGLKPWSSERQILDRYWKDAGSEIAPAPRHVNRDVVASAANEAEAIRRLSSNERSALDRARTLWSRMIQGVEPAWPHNATLKYFAMERAQSEAWLAARYSMVFIDEAQDVQAVLLEWVKALKALPVVLVGDPFQSIYGWAGARDAMRVAKQDNGDTDNVHGQLLQLTNSFRFAEPVAAIATQLLRRFALIAADNVGVVGAAAWSSRVAVYRTRPRQGGVVTYLARTNRVLLRAALKAVNAGRRVTLVGRSNEAVERLRALAQRYDNEEQIQSRIAALERRAAAALLSGGASAGGGAAGISPTTTVEPLSENEQRDLDILRLCVECSLATMRTLADHLRERAKCNDADTVLSTVHAFKGLEADRVTMLNDFPCLPALLEAWRCLATNDGYDADKLISACHCGECHHGLTFNVLRNVHAESLIREEVHLYYVAMTRAKHVLTLNRSARRVFADAHFDRRVPPDDELEADDQDGVNPVTVVRSKSGGGGAASLAAGKRKARGFAAHMPDSYRRRLYKK